MSICINHPSVCNSRYERHLRRIIHFIGFSLYKIMKNIQKLWMWRNNLEPWRLNYHLEGCEETIDEDGNPCLFHRTPPRTGKLKRIWNKLTFGVNDD